MDSFTPNPSEEKKRLRHEVVEKTVGYVVTAFGVVAGLAWNEAVKELIDYVYPAQNANTLAAKFLYALLITTIIIILSVYLVRFAGGNKNGE